MVGGLLKFGHRPLASLLNRSMAGLGSLGHIAFGLICNKDIYLSELVHSIFIVLFMNLMHASACPLL